MNKTKSDYKAFLKKIKPEYLVIVLVCIVALCMLFSSLSDKTAQTSSESSSVYEYVEMLENKLSAKLSDINGAGKVSVIISVKQGMTTQIATDKTVIGSGENRKEEETPLIVSGKPVVLTEKYPEICGVIIIAKGANNIKVRLSLMDAAQTFLDVSSEKIKVLTMK